MSFARQLVLLGATASLFLSAFLSFGYRRADSREFLYDQDEYAKFLFKIGVYGGRGGSRETELSEFRAQAVPGDRVEKRHHWFDSVGLVLLEASLWREDRPLAHWREFALPVPVTVLLVSFSPLILAGFFAIRAKPAIAPQRARNGVFVPGIVALAAVSAAFVFWRVAGFQESGALAVETATQQFKRAVRDPEGYWTGDVAELYRRKRILREVAEADAAPLQPLVSPPRPFHGYLFVAMETGPCDEAPYEPVPLKPGPRNKTTFGICAYPAQEGPDQKVWLICPSGFFGRRMDGGKPVLRWPSDVERRTQWGRSCGIIPSFVAALASQVAR